MHIVFGWYLDGRGYPATAEGTSVAINQPVVGPQGLLELLESALGLAGTVVPAAVRIARYQGRLRSLDDGNRFYSRSFARDAWSTSKQILAWRDELYAAGWQGQSIVRGGGRIETLASLENTGGLSLGRCSGERLNAVLDALRHETSLPIKRIDLLSPENKFPLMWRHLFDLLKSKSVSFRILQPQANKGTSDLAAVQRSFLVNNSVTVSGDGSFVVLDAEDEWQAADAVAAWLASGDNSGTVIIRGSGSAVLDAACHRQGLPRPGITESSPQRSVLQVLPLALEMLWEPLDLARILEFLSLPGSPLPSFVSHRFARALMLEPGIGGEPWTEAWQSCVTDLAKWRNADGLDDAAVRKATDKARNEWQFWLEPQRFSRTAGIPAKTVQDVCQRISRWSAGAAQKNNDLLFMTAASHASALSEATAALATPFITAIQLGRMIDAITAEGASAPSASEEAAPWSVVDTPGQIWNTADSLVWWGFTDNTSSPPCRPWSNSEIEALSASDIHFEPIENIIFREADSWHQAILNTGSRAILVMPRRLHGEIAPPHPLWHEISARLDSPGSLTKAKLPAESLSDSDTTKLSDRVIYRQGVSPLSLPSAQRWWKVPHSTVSRRPKESISSIKTLIECPFAWALKYGAKIQPGALNTLPDDEMLTGILAHAVVEDLFTRHKNWTPDDAAKEAVILFDSLAVTKAAPLLRQGCAIEFRRAKERISDSVRKLVQMIADAGLTVRGCEEEAAADIAPGQNFFGYLDLVLEDRNGRSVVLDLKWSKNDTYRRNEIRDGRALQLAAYTWLEQQAGRTSAGAGYYMLRQQTLLFTSPSPFPSSCHVPGSDLEQTWTELRTAYDYRMTQLESGSVLVRGIKAADGDADIDPMPQLEPGCNFCNYQSLCGV